MVWFNCDPCGLICASLAYTLFGFADVTFCFHLMWAWPAVFRYVNVVLFNMLTGVCIWSHLRCMLTDPGAVPKAEGCQYWDQDFRQAVAARSNSEAGSLTAGSPYSGLDNIDFRAGPSTESASTSAGSGETAAVAVRKSGGRRSAFSCNALCGNAKYEMLRPGTSRHETEGEDLKLDGADGSDVANESATPHNCTAPLSRGVSVATSIIGSVCCRWSQLRSQVEVATGPTLSALTAEIRSSAVDTSATAPSGFSCEMSFKGSEVVWSDAAVSNTPFKTAAVHLPRTPLAAMPDALRNSMSWLDSPMLDEAFSRRGQRHQSQPGLESWPGHVAISNRRQSAAGKLTFADAIRNVPLLEGTLPKFTYCPNAGGDHAAGEEPGRGSSSGLRGGSQSSASSGTDCWQLRGRSDPLSAVSATQGNSAKVKRLHRLQPKARNITLNEPPLSQEGGAVIHRGMAGGDSNEPATVSAASAVTTSIENISEMEHKVRGYILSDEGNRCPLLLPLRKKRADSGTFQPPNLTRQHQQLPTGHRVPSSSCERGRALSPSSSLSLSPSSTYVPPSRIAPRQKIGQFPQSPSCSERRLIRSTNSSHQYETESLKTNLNIVLSSSTLSTTVSTLSASSSDDPPRLPVHSSSHTTNMSNQCSRLPPQTFGSVTGQTSTDKTAVTNSLESRRTSMHAWEDRHPSSSSSSLLPFGSPGCYSGQRRLSSTTTLGRGSLAAGVRVCKRCGCPKPARAHHCSICSRCVLKMDHHCPWINNCVGLLNQKHFLLFLLYTNVICGYVLVALSFRVGSCLPSNSSPVAFVTASARSEADATVDSLPSFKFPPTLPHRLSSSPAWDIVAVMKKPYGTIALNEELIQSSENSVAQDLDIQNRSLGSDTSVNRAEIARLPSSNYTQEGSQPQSRYHSVKGRTPSSNKLTGQYLISPRGHRDDPNIMKSRRRQKREDLKTNRDFRLSSAHRREEMRAYRLGRDFAIKGLLTSFNSRQVEIPYLERRALKSNEYAPAAFSAIVDLLRRTLSLIPEASCTISTTGSVCLAIVFIEALVFGLFSLIMACDQISAITSNTTGVEQLKNYRSPKRSFYANLAEVFGGSFGWRWFLPTPVSFHGIMKILSELDSSSLQNDCGYTSSEWAVRSGANSVGATLATGGEFRMRFSAISAAGTKSWSRGVLNNTPTIRGLPPDQSGL